MQGCKMKDNVGAAIQVIPDMENQAVIFRVLEIIKSFVVELGTTLYMKQVKISCNIIPTHFQSFYFQAVNGKHLTDWSHLNQFEV